MQAHTYPTPQLNEDGAVLKYTHAIVHSQMHFLGNVWDEASLGLAKCFPRSVSSRSSCPGIHAAGNKLGWNDVSVKGDHHMKGTTTQPIHK